MSNEEKYKGEEQGLLFRILTKHQTALDRQVVESIIIKEVAAEPETCLILKIEWADSKLPVLLVTKPKGTEVQMQRGGIFRIKTVNL